MNIPNIITLSRIGLIPFFVCSFYSPFEYRAEIAAIIFAFMAITDYIDGFLARRFNQSSENGAILDLLADKMAVLIALFILVEYYASIWITLPAIIILAREVLVVHVRAIAQERFNDTNTLAASRIGKFKTALQMLAVVLLLFGEKGGLIASFGLVLFYISVVAAVWSAAGYAHKFYRALVST